MKKRANIGGLVALIIGVVATVVTCSIGVAVSVRVSNNCRNWALPLPFTKSVPYEDVTVNADKGTLYMVYPAQRLLELSDELRSVNISIKEVYFIITNASRNINIVLIKAVKNAKSDIKIKYIDVRDLKTYKNINW